jgi:rfaE bifunctional protein nucleotidyltransferase chain/domain
MNNKIVFISGVFDLFHDGHKDLLRQAAEYGRVFVAVNGDKYVRKTKGPLRPIYPANERMQHVIGSGYASWVCVNEEDSPLSLILGLKPAYLAVGSDYTLDQIVGLKEAAGWGGQAVIVPRTNPISTTRILQGKHQHE